MEVSVNVHEFLIKYSQNTLFMLELSRDYVDHDNMQMKSCFFLLSYLESIVSSKSIPSVNQSHNQTLMIETVRITPSSSLRALNFINQIH